MIKIFGRNFSSFYNLRRAEGLTAFSKSNVIKRYGSFENYYRKRFPKLTDEEIIDMLINFDNQVNLDAPTEKALKLMQNAINVQLQRDDLPRDEAYDILKQLYNSKSFSNDLKKLLKVVKN